MAETDAARDQEARAAPELEPEDLDGEAVLLVQLAGQLQAEAGLVGGAVHTHLGSRLGAHVRHIKHIPQQAPLSQLPAPLRWLKGSIF